MPPPTVRDPRIGTRPWLSWAGFTVVALTAGTLVGCSFMLRDHADRRREIMDRLTRIETRATAQSAIVWRALTTQMAEDRHGVIRLRAEEQEGRGAIYALLEELRALDARGAGWNDRLGFEADPQRLDRLDDAASAFLGGTQGAFGQMTLAPERLRDRLRYWDMNFGSFRDALHEVKEHHAAIAEASSLWARRVTNVAAALTLLTTALFVLRLSWVRARQARELQAERIKTLSASEARFRELVQHSSDMILVLDPKGRVRYATPSAEVLASRLRDDVEPERLEETAMRALAVAEAIEASIESGTLRDAEQAIVSATCAIDEVFGLTASELLENTTSQVVVTTVDGSQRIFEVHASDLTDIAEVGGVVLNAHDVTEAKELEERLRHQALHDPLTNLPNRRDFVRRFDALAQEDRACAAVLFIDLDGFKLVNDSYGHAVGDQLLVVAASRIGSCLGARDVLARQGGDEFLALVLSDAGSMSERILRVLTAPFVVNGKEVFVSASIGVVEDVSDLDSEQAAQRADIAMYAAKKAGKARSQTFTESMLGGAADRLELEADFRRALDRGEFTVHYQPKVGFASHRTESLEALVRWEHPTRGFVGPDSFIPFAEESGLINELGQAVLEQACRDAVRWQEHGVVVAVNLSPIQFRNPRLVQDIADVLARTGLNPEHLELEITESAVLGDLDNTIRMLAELKALGVRLAIDDFGTGYSNLSHLKHFNVDVLKIDQAFVRGGDPGSLTELSDAPIITAVIGMAKAFGLHVVAEGVESEAHAQKLHALGADFGQGYYFSKPVPGERIDEILAGEAAATPTS